MWRGGHTGAVAAGGRRIAAAWNRPTIVRVCDSLGECHHQIPPAALTVLTTDEVGPGDPIISPSQATGLGCDFTKALSAPGTDRPANVLVVKPSREK
jgi:hypothetical protein